MAGVLYEKGWGYKKIFFYERNLFAQKSEEFFLGFVEWNLIEQIE